MNMVEELAKTYPWAENLRVYNKLLKIKSTYVDRFRDRQEDGRYYYYFKQNGTVSGRYGSDAQQLPKPLEEGEDAPVIMKYVNIVRRFLVAGKGRKVIDCDYESLEPHCFASVTGDKNLQDIFNNDWDFYSTVAIRTENLESQTDRFPNGVSADKSSPVFLKKLDPVARNKAKAYSLGIAYGMEEYALSMGLYNDARWRRNAMKEMFQRLSDASGLSESKFNELSDKEILEYANEYEIPFVSNGRPNVYARKAAEKLVEGYFSGFPELFEWKKRSRQQVKETGRIENEVGRIRHIPKVQKLYSKLGDRMLDWRFRKELETKIPPKLSLIHI